MPNYNFTLDTFQITDTRSLHEDTDYLSFTLQIGFGTPQTLVKSMGSINNGTHAVQLSFSNIAIGVTDPVTISYLIVNSGSTAAATVETTLKNVAAPFSAGNVNGSPLPVTVPFGSALQLDASWFAAEFKGIFKSNCDGIVAAERTIFSIGELQSWPGGLPYHQSTLHSGTDSNAGCGGNSSYVVNWHVGVSATVPDVEQMSVAKAETKIHAAGLNYSTIGRGSLVAAQGPGGGAIVDLGSTVALTLGNVGR